MPPFPDPRMNNPMFNPNAPMPFFNPQFMFPPPQPGMDPLFHLQSGMPDPRLAQRFGVPRPDWIEAIFIFPDGTIHRSFQDPRAMVTNISSVTLFHYLDEIFVCRVWVFHQCNRLLIGQTL